MTWRLGCAAVCFAALAACASTEGDSAQVASAEPEERSCRMMLAPGSNVIERICMTRSQWRRYREEEYERSQALARTWRGEYGGY